MKCLVARFQDRLLRFELPSSEARLGSTSGNDIVIPFPGVSRSHARVMASLGGVMIHDLGSRNGLFRGQERVRELLLRPGESVRIGRAVLTIEDGSTSDIELSLRLDVQAGRKSSQHETDSDRGPEPEEGPLEALRYVRNLERAGPKPFEGADGRLLLSRARAVLSAETLMSVEATESGELSLLEVDGPSPSERMLERLDEALRSGRYKGPFVLSADPHQVLAIRRRGRGPATVDAVSFKTSDRIPEWKREFFEYVGEKLSRRPPGGTESASAEPASVLSFPPGMVLGDSPAMAALLSSLAATVQSRFDILLLGETGTGKELFARMIHASGPTRSGPFVAINCAAIPADLLESELFGVQGRVATGVDPRPGLFLQADGGSILLDEIGELAESLQAKLLRFLQEREVMPIGGSIPRKLNVRVISVSNRDLLAAVEEHRFRPDLYYRLRSLEFQIPPLRERKEDIPTLVLAFAGRAAAATSKRIAGVTRGALSLLMAHDWPGNIRELESEVQRAALLCRSGESLRAAHFAGLERSREKQLGRGEPLISADVAERPHVSEALDSGTSFSGSLKLEDLIGSLERQAIGEALDRSKGNKTVAARLLGITRNGLGLKMARLRLSPERDKE